MSIISEEIMKTTRNDERNNDERERCDKRCAVMRWSNSEV